ncbi:DUF3040 domain-containing protein [Nonomuraea sp. LPB2021202275-12-8]|uniref:DUF3040 domain-containing protein n=1 Tax=Nonomuraea sp. LPB2021202275-12-8 TaxID=3120159 RepID=UPI00300D6F59
MSLSGKERRILAEIEQALERDDPELARRVAAINRIESGADPAQRVDDALARPRDVPPRRAEPIPRAAPRRLPRHGWLVVVVVALTFLLLVLAVATA